MKCYQFEDNNVKKVNKWKMEIVLGETRDHLIWNNSCLSKFDRNASEIVHLHRCSLFMNTFHFMAKGNDFDFCNSFGCSENLWFYSVSFLFARIDRPPIVHEAYRSGFIIHFSEYTFECGIVLIPSSSSSFYLSNPNRKPDHVFVIFSFKNILFHCVCVCSANFHCTTEVASAFTKTRIHNTQRYKEEKRMGEQIKRVQP